MNYLLISLWLLAQTAPVVAPNPGWYDYIVANFPQFAGLAMIALVVWKMFNPAKPVTPTPVNPVDPVNPIPPGLTMLQILVQLLLKACESGDNKRMGILRTLIKDEIGESSPLM